ncbi:DUF2306 domain-containing protein [Roseinatronobacter sp. NSM]|uniref:DUF2306 domain-containing protein n=1 Tax=Roseinatronobacter sp. NSM TaxID=3457785 RepID=UPI00403740D3
MTLNLHPLLNATLAIQLHTASAVVAILATLLIFTRPRGSGAHRVLGWMWVGAMLAVAISSFGITHGGPVWGYGWIHLLSVWVIAGIFYAIIQIRRGHVARHRGMMLGIVWGGLVIAGAFTLSPGRIMHAVLLGG